MTAREVGCRLGLLALVSCLATACGGRQQTESSATLFESPAAALAKELAPDLYANADIATAGAERARRDRDPDAAEELETEARLWLAAAATEGERIELDRRRAELEREEERWSKQLGRDQEAAAAVARDISLYEARDVALREAERLSPNAPNASTEQVVAALLSRARLNLALARALGASQAELRPREDRAAEIETRSPRSADLAEALLLDTEALIGTMRRQWPEPLPGASTELVQTALVMGFVADRTNTGVIVRSDGFFDASGQVSGATVRRFEGLLAAFPHGPVACQVGVSGSPNKSSTRRAAGLVDRLERTEAGDRVSTTIVRTKALPVGAVQCTFAAYR